MILAGRSRGAFSGIDVNRDAFCMWHVRRSEQLRAVGRKERVKATSLISVSLRLEADYVRVMSLKNSSHGTEMKRTAINRARIRQQ